MPHWIEDFADEDEAFQYIRSGINDSVAAGLLVNRIADNQYYKGLLNNTHTVDLLLDYLNTHKEDIHNEYSLYEHILLSGQWNSAQLTALQVAAYNLYVNDLFTFRKETFESAQNGLEPITIIQYSAILEQQDVWYRFPTKAFHIFLAVRYIINLPEKERIDLYRSFEEDNDCVYYENGESLWRLCYEADKDLFCAHFIIPVIQTELNTIFKEDEDEMVINYLEKHIHDYEFDFWKEEQQFEFDCGGGGNFLLEAIARSFEEWNIPDPFWEIADCFNISLIKNTAVSKYMRQHCPVIKGKYRIDVANELKNKAFRKLLKPAGVTKIIVDYATALKNLLLKLQKENMSNPNE